MKNLILIASVFFIAVLSSCNSSMEWNEETKKEFNSQCLNKLAKKFKADNPTEFCECFVGKLEADKMGMMDMIKNSARLAKDCGANLEGL